MGLYETGVEEKERGREESRVSIAPVVRGGRIELRNAKGEQRHASYSSKNIVLTDVGGQDVTTN